MDWVPQQNEDLRFATKHIRLSPAEARDLIAAMNDASYAIFELARRYSTGTCIRYAQRLDELVKGIQSTLPPAERCE